MQKLKNMKRTLKNQAGITLVELLAVLVILGIVAAIAVPAIGNIIENAEEDAVKSDAISLLEAARLAVASGDVTGDSVSREVLEEYIEVKSEWGENVNISVANGEPELTATYKKDDKVSYTFTSVTIDDINNKDFDEDGVLTGSGSAGGGEGE